MYIAFFFVADDHSRLLEWEDQVQKLKAKVVLIIFSYLHMHGHCAHTISFAFLCFWATITSGCALLCYGTVVLCVLSVSLVYCGQTVGWIQMPLGTEVGLGPGGSSPTERGTAAPSTFAVFFLHLFQKRTFGQVFFLTGYCSRCCCHPGLSE